VRDVEHALSLGRDWSPPDAPANRGPALDDVTERWLRAQAEAWDVATRRVRSYQTEVWLRWCAEQGHETTSALSGAMLLDYLAHLKGDTGRHGAPRVQSTARRYLRVVEALWAWAYDWQDEERTWSGTVPRPRRVSDRVRVPTQGWRPAPTWAEMQAVIAAADGWLRELLTGCYYTGLRVDQVLRLRLDDLDVARAVLHIRPELGKTAQEQTGREVPVSPHMVSWATSLPPVEGGWMVPARANRRADPTDTAAAWRRAGVREAAWEGRPHHALRAGWMSGLRRADVQLDVIEVLVGHAPTKTARSYYDPDSFPMRGAVAKVPPHRGDG
jgi:integrase